MCGSPWSTEITANKRLLDNYENAHKFERPALLKKQNKYMHKSKNDNFANQEKFEISRRRDGIIIIFLLTSFLVANEWRASTLLLKYMKQPFLLLKVAL